MLPRCAAADQRTAPGSRHKLLREASTASSVLWPLLPLSRSPYRYGHIVSTTIVLQGAGYKVVPEKWYSLGRAAWELA